MGNKIQKEDKNGCKIIARDFNYVIGAKLGKTGDRKDSGTAGKKMK